MAKKFGLAPIARPDARLLLLGSLPGEASLLAERYYAHPRNQFWRLVGEVIGEELEPLDYAKRLKRLAARGIALWDVVHAAERKGSLDGQMRAVEARDLAGFIRTLPELRAVGFNGAAAARIGRRALESSDLVLFDLPSSSPAYTLAVTEKAARWAALRPFLD